MKPSAIEEAKSECPDCGGMGYLAFIEGYSTILLPCPRCLPPSRYTFATFQEAAGVHVALKAARAFADGDGPPWLMILGGHGSGKTHLARAVHRRLMERLCPSIYVYSIDLFDRLREAFHYRDEPDFVHYMEFQYIGTPHLIIDDLGAERETLWVQERAEKILNIRHEKELRTLITSNLGLADFPGALQSRMGDRRLCLVVHLVADDFRKGKHADA